MSWKRESRGLWVLVSTAVVLAIALLAAGCGDSGDSGASAEGAEVALEGPPLETSSLSKAAFIKKASAACNRERQKSIAAVGAYLEKHDNEGLSEAVLIAKAFQAGLLPAIEKEIAAIRELGVPAGDEEQVEAMLAAQQAAIDEVEQQASFKNNQDFEKHFVAAAKLFHGYGFQACTLGG